MALIFAPKRDLQNQPIQVEFVEICQFHRKWKAKPLTYIFPKGRDFRHLLVDPAIQANLSGSNNLFTTECARNILAFENYEL